MLNETKKITLRDEETLHANIVEKGSPIWLIVTHGLGEHSERHSYHYNFFSQYMNICLYDLRGHGLSTGKRGYVKSFKDYIEDLDEVVYYLKENYAMKRYILFGHSMGGLITASYMQNKAKTSFYPEKVFLSAPAVAGAGLLGRFFQVAPMKLMHMLRSLPLSLALEGLVDLSRLSHDPRVYESYITDSQNILKIHSKLFFELLSESRSVFSRPLRTNCELFCAIGMNDCVVDPKAVETYFTEIEKSAKLFKVQSGYHELHNEIDKYRELYFDFLKTSLLGTLFDSV